MTPFYDYMIPEYIQYWMQVGPWKFVRVFWYFVIFELTRYISADFFIAGWYQIFSKERKRKWAEAKTDLSKF